MESPSGMLSPPVEENTPNMAHTLSYPPASGFLHLPLEIRNMIYELLLQSSIVERPVDLTFNYSTRLWENPLLDTHQFDLSITTTKVSFPNLRLPSNVIYANRQTYDELSTLIYSKIRHLKLTGDFLLGLAPTQAIFDMLERRPWVHSFTRSVTIVLKFNHVLPLMDSVAVNSDVADLHPWLCSRLRIAELSVRRYDMWGDFRIQKPETWIQRYLLRKLGLGKQSLDYLLSWLHISPIAAKPEHNTLPDLAKLFETFPLLEKIDIQTDHCVLLSLFPAPKETASSFLPLHQNGVEVNILLRNWQVSQFCSMLYRNGVETGSIQFASYNHRVVDLSYERLVAGARPEEGVVRYRLLDCILPEREMVENFVGTMVRLADIIHILPRSELFTDSPIDPRARCCRSGGSSLMFGGGT
jgi:hypothetical protein